jgi:hypothetical protein
MVFANIGLFYGLFFIFCPLWGENAVVERRMRPAFGGRVLPGYTKKQGGALSQALRP